MLDWASYIRKNENEALRKLYLEYKQAFISFVRQGNKLDEDEAKELFQTSVIILYDNVIQGKIETIDNIKNYLFTIGRNKSMELFRKKKVTQSFENISFAAYIADEDDNGKLQFETDILQMQKALFQLGDPCKTLLELFYFKSLSNSQIAQQMSYQNENTVKTKKYKCIQRVRKIFTGLKQTDV